MRSVDVEQIANIVRLSFDSPPLASHRTRVRYRTENGLLRARARMISIRRSAIRTSKLFGKCSHCWARWPSPPRVVCRRSFSTTLEKMFGAV
jgi:hypothetical protein